MDDLYSVEQVDFLEDCEHGLADVVEVGDTVLWSLQYIVLNESEKNSAPINPRSGM